MDYRGGQLGGWFVLVETRTPSIHYGIYVVRDEWRVRGSLRDSTQTLHMYDKEGSPHRTYSEGHSNNSASHNPRNEYLLIKLTISGLETFLSRD